MLRAMLVDLDGTLVDTVRANAAAYASALEEVGVVIPPQALAPLIDGRSCADFLPPLLAGRNDVDPKKVAARKAELYPAFFPSTTCNGALAGLLELCRDRLKTALVTTAARRNTMGILAHHKLESLFDIIICREDVSRAKPDPEAYRLAAVRLEVKPEECLVIEDSETGLAAAAAFGAPVLRRV